MQLLNSWVVGRNQDQVKWKTEPSSGFSTKSTFLNLTKGAPENNFPMVALIWKLKIPIKSEGFPFVSCLRKHKYSQEAQKGSSDVGPYLPPFDLSTLLEIII